MEEEKLWYCKSCEAEFDPYAEEVTIMWEGSRFFVIQDRSGRAHSLNQTTWEKIQRRRELGNQSLSFRPSNLYGDEENGTHGIELYPEEEVEPEAGTGTFETTSEEVREESA
jgi:hypothetical protein